MSLAWQLRIYENQNLTFSTELTGPAELGRQNEREEGPYYCKTGAGASRLVIARRDEQEISRRHARLEPLIGNRVRLTNLSTKRPIQADDGTEISPGGCCELGLPVVLSLGKKVLRVQPASPSSQPALQTLYQATMPPGSAAAVTRFPALKLPTEGAADAKALIRWLQQTMTVFQSAASTTDFFDRAAQAVVFVAGLDNGRVLLLEKGEWQLGASQTAAEKGPQADMQASRHVLNRVREDRRTFWDVPDTPDIDSPSLRAVQAVVAAPILDRNGQVIGALYGDRRHGGPGGPVTDLEAMLVELLACGVAAGLARLEQEKAALAAHVRFEQFFAPELARQLIEHPELLIGKDAQISVLFCDIRGFSGVSERLGPAATMECVGDVLTALSEAVRSHEGVLVDYIGDELVAMWGAPQERSDHAQLACRAALDMITRLPELDKRWQPRTGESLGIGIGINTGTALVGNTGTPYKYKYGPLGHTVNFASRVQGATKFLQSSALITGATQARLNGDFATRRLGRVRVVNIREPVDLYELATGREPGWGERKQGYESALEQFEKQSWRQAARILGNMILNHPDDGPSLVLLSRAVNALVDKHVAFDPVWELPGK